MNSLVLHLARSCSRRYSMVDENCIDVGIFTI